MAEYYDWLKAFHLIFVIFWMAGLLYLPRLYVYHSQVKKDSDQDILFRLMEKRLLRIIMNPAMIISIILGLLIAYIYGFKNLGIWFHIKMSLVLILTYYHHFLGKVRKAFESGNNQYSSKFFRVINEVPGLIMVITVILVIVKPFS